MASPHRAASLSAGPAARVSGTMAISLQVTFDEASELMVKQGLPAIPIAASDETAVRSAALAIGSRKIERAEADPLVAIGAEYARGTWHVLQALRPILAARADPVAVDSAERLEEMCVTIASKIFRAVSSSLDDEEGAGSPGHDIESDANGSAKVALLLLEESRQAWRVLMQPGRAAADGFPARQVEVLDGIEADLLKRFPLALQFVRPGFDTGADAGDNHQIALALLGTGKGES